MTLLEALNHVLRSVGESHVDSINTNHKEHQTILATIIAQNSRRQERGWWFNKYVADLPNSTLPTGTVFARPLNRGLDYYPQSGVLYNRRTGAPVSGAIPQVELQRLVAFEALPQEFADYVVTAAALAYASDYDADETHLAALQTQLQDAEVLVHRLHIRYYETELVSKRLQGRGWWFNTSRRLLSLQDAQGIIVPPSYLFVKPLQRSWDYFPRNGRLVDRATGEYVKHPVDCEVREYISNFEELPPSFQDYVTAVAELERAQDFLPSSSSIPRLRVNMEEHRRNVQQDHIKYAAVNLFATPSMGSSLSRSWGYRYKV